MINVYAPINVLGYGIHACNVIKALIENGEELSLEKLGNVQADPFFEMYWKEAEQNKIDENSPSVFIFHDEYSLNAKGNPILTFSIFETDKLKESSIKALKEGPTTAILTTTAEHKSILEQHIDKPIHVINEGIDDCLYNTIPTDKYIDTKKFTYITVGKKEERKNTDIILETFINEMKEKNVALISHTFNMFIHDKQDHPFKNLNCWSGINPLKRGFEYKGFNGKAHLFSYKNCDIYFTTPTIPISIMPALYHSANIGIQISRGEGWDLPLTEMLACGIPTITTDCLGHKEYLGLESLPDIQKNLIINSLGSEVANDNVWFKGDQGNWDMLDYDNFKSTLLSSYENENLYTDKDDNLADFMSDNFSWDKSTQTLIDTINLYK